MLAAVRRLEQVLATPPTAVATPIAPSCSPTRVSASSVGFAARAGDALITAGAAACATGASMALASVVAFSSALHVPRSVAAGAGDGAGPTCVVAVGMPDIMPIGSTSSSVAVEPRRDPSLCGIVADNARSATIKAATLLMSTPYCAILTTTVFLLRANAKDDSIRRTYRASKMGGSTGTGGVARRVWLKRS